MNEPMDLLREVRDIRAGRITPKPCNGTHLMVFDSFACVRCGWYPKLQCLVIKP